ncbi:MAG: hypothetical protein IJS54_06995 [Desulfovibrio sp.]|nr:hypothetical protein [Desulfovibrio sp.]
MLSFMLFSFLGFLCLAALLVYFLYTQEKIARTLQDEHAELRLLLRQMDARITALAGKEKENDVLGQEADHLLHLDFDSPQKKPSTDMGLDLHFDEPEERKL